MEHIVDRNALVGGMRIAHGVHGTGEPVVLVHGTPSSSLIWRDVVPELVAAGFRAHVFDLLGYGLSERPCDPDIDTSISGQVPILEALLDHWRLERLHLVAHDIGGGVAQRFALAAPDRIASLTLIDTVSFDSYPSSRTRQQMQAGLEVLIKKPDAEHRAHFEDWLLSAVHDKARLRDGALGTYLDFISGPVGQASFFQHQVRHYDPRHTMDIADRMGELGRLPVKLIWGAEDAWQVTDWARRLHAAIPGSELDIVEACGHFAMEDRPEALANLVIDFMRRHR